AARLSAADASCFSLIDQRHGGEVAAVAHLAETTLRLTSENAADLHRLETRLLDEASHVFVDELTSFDQQRALAGLVDLVHVVNVFSCHGADDTLGQRLDGVLALPPRSPLAAGA